MRKLHKLILMVSLVAVSAGCGKKDTAGTGDGTTPPTPAISSGIEGVYTVVGGEFLGEPTKPEDLAKDSEDEKTIRITKDTIEMVLLGTKAEKLKYTIDSSKSPAQLDIVLPEKKGKKEEFSYGIYKMEGDTLTFFVMGSNEAKNRPKEFKTLKPTKDTKEQAGGLLFVVAKKK